MSPPNPNSESSDTIFWGMISAQPSSPSTPGGALTAPPPGRDIGGRLATVWSLGDGSACKPAPRLGRNLPAFFPRMTWLRMNLRVFESGLARDVAMMKGSRPGSTEQPEATCVVVHLSGSERTELGVVDGMEWNEGRSDVWIRGGTTQSERFGEMNVAGTGDSGRFAPQHCRASWRSGTASNACPCCSSLTPLDCLPEAVGVV